jgi:hypothetical protein
LIQDKVTVKLDSARQFTSLYSDLEKRSRYASLYVRLESALEICKMSELLQVFLEAERVQSPPAVRT